LDGVAAPAAVTLTIADDDEGITEPPAVTLLLTPASIDEDGGVSVDQRERWGEQGDGDGLAG
jgi:hypothetical protein